ncbi:hypothetical protein [Jeotgalicoccus psychrophilus]|uniref:hypothetical protein n=1 Tax=Jeotgalicoccus psychrophilus TaxID=157228 RepID=UPI000429CAEA|nr:hypothetical protein [Jeotgalicoccus psychrophilus]
MTLTGKETNYYIARYNNSSEEHSVLRFNSYNGLFSAVNDFEGASKYSTFEEVKQLVDVHNMMANLTGQAYEYYAMKHDVESFRLDENGDVVTEEKPVEEQPSE